MKILFVFDSSSVKSRVESLMLRNGLLGFHSILDHRNLQDWLKGYKPELVVIALAEESVFNITQIISQGSTKEEYLIVSDELNSDTVDNVKIISNTELTQLIENKFANSNITIQKGKEDVLIKINDKYKRIRTSEIVYVEAEGKYVNLVLKERTYNIRTSLKSLILILPNNFIRTHASYIINIEKIDAIHINEQNIEAAGHNIPYSRKYKNAILDKFHLG